MCPLQPPETIPPPRNADVVLRIFMTALLDSGYVSEKNLPFNNIRELNGQYMLKHSVESQMLDPNSVIAMHIAR
jgi:hypothetical protein